MQFDLPEILNQNCLSNLQNCKTPKLSEFLLVKVLNPESHASSPEKNCFPLTLGTHHSLHKSLASEIALAQRSLFSSQLVQLKPKAHSMFDGKLLLWPEDIF